MSNSCMNLKDCSCNDCIPASQILFKTAYDILYKHYLLFDSVSYIITQYACPNLTCCPECHIDDFCHIEGCERAKRINKQVDEIKENLKTSRRTNI